MIRVTLEIKGTNDVDMVRNEFMKQMKVFSDNVKISVEKVCELTEDERVILRNIDKKFTKIGRVDLGLYFIFCQIEKEQKYFASVFDNVFQFIKERRRI